MAGRDSNGAGPPAVVLVGPQLGENIGAVARAMGNFALADLRLVSPRDPWPNPKAWHTAAAAGSVLDAARLYDDSEAAIADLGFVLAATARRRDMVKPALTPREAAAALHAARMRGAGTGILFGCERTGLDNADAVRADALVMVPTDAACSSLNLAQAVLVIAYEWFQAGPEADKATVSRKGSKPAEKAEIAAFFAHLEAELDACGFLHPPEKRPAMVRSIRNIFSRTGLTDQEVRTLRGIVAGLAAGRPD
jgi:tRNA/rRNA methyltransferase